MNIGIPRELVAEESCVALTPPGVRSLVSKGHTVFLESKAGEGSKFLDENYRTAGASIVYSHEEAFGRADLLLKVSPLVSKEYDLIHEGQTILSFLHLPVAARRDVEKLVEGRVTALGYEKIRNASGRHPVQDILSEIAGHMSVFMGAEFLKSHKGGRGILLAGMPGVPPGIVVILGAGVVGRSAARAAAALGALVVVLDDDVTKLQEINWLLPRQVSTAYSHGYAVEKAVSQANLLVGAISLHGRRIPHIVSEEMVKGMKEGAVIVDVSINEGGCVATSRPTTLRDPVYVKHGVIHFCVPNIPAAAGRGSTRALTNAALRYVEALAEMGTEKALQRIPELAESVYIRKGDIIDANLALTRTVPHAPVPEGDAA